ncbi:MAG: DUF2974 domain-containing protein [Oscillospiraceae bacterium]
MDNIPEKKQSGILQTYTIIDYVENELSTLDKKPFSPVDSLVLSQMSYMHLGCAVGFLGEGKRDVRIAELYRAELFHPMLDEIRDPESNRKLLNALCASPRFRDIRLNLFTDTVDAEQEKQFCAVTCMLSDGSIYVAFRGTDATVVGWKEDLNMTFISPVPSQTSAVAYLDTVAKKCRGDILVGGHSKGGNLAIYASVYAKPRVQTRIKQVFSHDGPGFKSEVLKSEGYTKISKILNKTLPKSSFVGMMLENSDDYFVVKSSRMGIMQHDPFSWLIDGDGFEYTEKITTSATYMNQTVNELISSLSEAKLRLFADTLFDVIESTDVEKIGEFPISAIKEASRVLDALKNIDEDTRKALTAILKQFLKVWLKTYLGMDIDIDKLELDQKQPAVTQTT